MITAARRTAGLPILIFDGDCGFCTSAVRLTQSKIYPGMPAQAYQEADLDALGLTRERAESEVLWVDPDGRVSGGASAVGRLLTWAGGPWAVCGAALMLPPLRWVAPLAYRLIAANRYRLPGGTPQCSVRAPAGRPLKD